MEPIGAFREFGNAPKNRHLCKEPKSNGLDESHEQFRYAQQPGNRLVLRITDMFLL